MGLNWFEFVSAPDANEGRRAVWQRNGLEGGISKKGSIRDRGIAKKRRVLMPDIVCISLTVTVGLHF